MEPKFTNTVFLKHPGQLRRHPPAAPLTTDETGEEETSEEDLLFRIAEEPPPSQGHIAATQPKQLQPLPEQVEAGGGWPDQNLAPPVGEQM